MNKDKSCRTGTETLQQLSEERIDFIRQCLDEWCADLGYKDSLERQIITYLFNHGPATRNELENYTGKARNTIMTRMKKLIAADLANASGTTNDPSRKYSLTAWTEN